MKQLIDKLRAEQNLSDEELITLIASDDPDTDPYLAQCADAVRRSVYGTDVYIRGLIEFTNYCKNDCYYCGIRRGNRNCCRYRLSPEQILSCCDTGYKLGFRTFVLQGGEDPYFTKERMTALIRDIKEAYPDCALTLSVGEKDRRTYQEWFDAGADRYLLRHEAADSDLYRALHPSSQSLENRMRCLEDLKQIGYQVGCGFMVGAPGQAPQMILKDLRYIQAFKPHMVGVGPFIPHRDTRFRNDSPGSAALTLRLLAIVRLMCPNVLLPATTALGTLMADGRLEGMKFGCNVIMPNLSPLSVREKYALYDNKISTGEEAAESIALLNASLSAIGYHIVSHRGDWKGGMQ